MNGRTRLKNAIEGKKCDRMPVAPFIWHNFIREFTGDVKADTIEKGIEVYKYFGFDIILRTCTIGGVLDFNNEYSDDWQVDTDTLKEQNGVVVTTTIKTPGGVLTERKNVRQRTRYYDVEAVFESFIKTPEDFELFFKYQPPVPRYDCSNITRARDLVGDSGLIAPWISGAFNTVARLRNL